MCVDSQTADLIRVVVQEHVDGDQMFTAFDISRVVQDRIKSSGLPFVRHRDMKNDVHSQVEQYVQQGIYSRKLHDVGAPSQAFLYFPPTVDPNAYVPQNRQSPNTNTVVVTPAIAQQVLAGQISAIDDGDDDDEGDEADSGRKTDSRGTLCVPNHVLRAAGFNSKEIAYVTVDNNQLILSKQVPAGQNSVSKYTVDYSDNVRITAATLANLGTVTNGYDFEKSGDRVIVKAH